MMFMRALALLLALSGSALAQSGQIPSGTVWGNPGASKAIATSATVTAILDRALGSVRGSIIERGAAGWGLIGPSAGEGVWVSHGTGADPGYSSVLSLQVKGHLLGNASGNLATTPLASSDANILMYNAAANNWAGIGTDNNGTFWIRTGTAGTPAAALYIDASRGVFVPTSLTAGVGAFSTSLTAPTTAASDSSSNVATTAFVKASAPTSFTPQGRLTLQSFTPVMTSSQAGKTTIYYTGYVGVQIPIFDGVTYIPTGITGGEISALTTDTTKSPAAIGASKVNDWFVWNDAGTIRLSHGPDWTNDTTRSAGTVVGINTGVLQNTVSITNGPAANRGTYVGTTRSNASSQLDWIIGSSAVGGGTASLYVWNAYNQVRVSTNVNDAAGNWNYTTNTFRAANGSNANRVNWVTGVAIHGVDANYQTLIRPLNVAAAWGEIGLALDSTTVPNIIGRNVTSSLTANADDANISVLYSYGAGLLLGAHFLQAVENGDGTNVANFFGGVRGGLNFSTVM